MNETDLKNTEGDEKKLRELVNTFINAIRTGDEEKFFKIWHPDARRFSIGNSNELNSFGLVEIVEYSLKGIKQLRKINPKSSKIQHILDVIRE